MTCYFAITLRKIPKPYELRNEIAEERMIEPIEDPRPERMHLEEDALLAELIELRIAIEQSGRYELVKNANHKWWEDCEKDVVEGQRPGFEYDLSRKAVLKGILRMGN